MERLFDKLQAVKDLITSDETVRKARKFSNALARASLAPAVLATPTAIVMSAADLGVAYAQGNCSVNVEFRPSNPNEARRTMEQTVPCNDSFSISVDAAKDHLIRLGPIQNSTLPDITWPQAAVGVAGLSLIGFLSFLLYKS